MDYSKKELVYSCSGCSSAAQTANTIAVQLDRQGVAEMSCIAGIGGDVAALVRVAKSGRPITVIDGCPLHCAKSCLQRHGVVPDRHYDLSKLGIKKVQHGNIDQTEAERIFELIKSSIEMIEEKSHGES